MPPPTAMAPTGATSGYLSHPRTSLAGSSGVGGLRDGTAVTSSDLITTDVYSTSGYAAIAKIDVYEGATPLDNQYLCSDYGDTQVQSNVYFGGTGTIDGTSDNSQPNC